MRTHDAAKSIKHSPSFRINVENKKKKKKDEEKKTVNETKKKKNGNTLSSNNVKHNKVSTTKRAHIVKSYTNKSIWIPKFLNILCTRRMRHNRYKCKRSFK